MKRYLGMKPSGPVETDCAPVDMVGPVSMRFRPVLPTDEQANSMIALQMVNAPKQMISLETALEKYLQLDDPLGEIDRIVVENAMKQPQLEQQWMAEALKRAGIAPPVPQPPPGILGPNGQPIASGQPAPGTNSVAGGEPSVPGLNEPVAGIQAMNQTPAIGQSSMAEHMHGPSAMPARAGAYPGRPGGPKQ